MQYVVTYYILEYYAGTILLNQPTVSHKFLPLLAVYGQLFKITDLKNAVMLVHQPCSKTNNLLLTTLQSIS